MNILFISNLASHYRVPVYERLARDHSVKFLFHSAKGGHYYDPANGVGVGKFDGEYLKGFNILPKFRITPKLVSYLLFHPYDCVIMGFTGRFSILATVIIAHFIRRKPIIGWMGLWSHPDTFAHRVSFPLTRYIYRLADALLVYGSHCTRYLVSLGVDGNKIFCAWNSVDNSKFEVPVTDAQKKEARQSLGIGDRPCILYVGRLAPLKGLDVLMEALVKVAQTQPGVACVLIGHGSEEHALKEYVAKYNLANVVFPGYVANNALPVYYALATALVLPSVTYGGHKETWGLVCNEAMIQGCPVIATDAVGAAMGGLIENGTDGFVVPERDSDALAKAILKLSTDPELRAGMGERCAKKMESWNPDFQYSGVQAALKYIAEAEKK